MTKESFIKGMAILKEVFHRDFNLSLYWKTLKDIDDTSFQSAVLKIIQTQKELYPNTNMIAIIREWAHTLMRGSAESFPKLTDQRSDPPPAEWEAMKKKLKSWGSIDA